MPDPCDYLDISANPAAHLELNHTSTRLILDERIGFPPPSGNGGTGRPGTAGDSCAIMGIFDRD